MQKYTGSGRDVTAEGWGCKKESLKVGKFKKLNLGTTRLGFFAYINNKLLKKNLIFACTNCTKFHYMAEITHPDKINFLKVLPLKNYHIQKTCEAIKIARRTFYTWLEADLEFKQAYEDLKQSEIDDSEEIIKLLSFGIPKHDKEGNFIGWKIRPHFGALHARLQAKAPDRGWGQKIEIISKKDDTSGMTDEQLKAEILKLSSQLDEEEWDTSKDGAKDGDK